jgi:RNA polymerase sigma-70 factor (ECF subfamily)
MAKQAMTGTSLLGRVPRESDDTTGEAVTRELQVRTLVDSHYEFVWRALRRLGVRDADVEDSVQRVFLVATRKLDAIRTGSERSFLFQTALRVAADDRRRDRRRREVPTSDDDEADPYVECEPEELVDMRRAREALDEILDGMDLDMRAVFTLFELDELTLTEIAELLSIPRGTVASRLRRAKAFFKEKASRYAWQRKTRGDR